MNLCIDIGNTSIKTALFSGSEIIEKRLLKEFGTKEVMKLRDEYPQISHVILCSVRPDNPWLLKDLRDNFSGLIVFDHETPVPVKNLYETRETLGKDRLAAVTGANNIYPGRAVLVVDAGTAITYDLVDESGHYLGGNISPGIHLRFKALHEYTGRLPLVDPRYDVPLVATTTEDAIASGVMNGVIFEMEMFAGRMTERFRDPAIILTGGDAKYFDKKLKNTIFVDPELVLKGLNRIITYNVEKK